MIHQMLAAGGAQPPIVVDGADFDGTNDYLTRGSDLSGNADGKVGLASFFFRIDGGDGTQFRFIYTASSVGGAAASGFGIQRTSSNKLQVIGSNSTPSIILSFLSTINVQAGAQWKHCLASWDMTSPPKRHLYIDDANVISPATHTNDTIEYTKEDWSVGAGADGGQKFSGCLAEFYFNTQQYLDLSLLGNRRKFIDHNLRPVFLGADGSVPTGTPPLIYLHLDDGEAADNFAINRGTGGNFTVNGALATASNSPSD